MNYFQIARLFQKATILHNDKFYVNRVSEQLKKCRSGEVTKGITLASKLIEYKTKRRGNALELHILKTLSQRLLTEFHKNDDTYNKYVMHYFPDLYRLTHLKYSRAVDFSSSDKTAIMEAIYDPISKQYHVSSFHSIDSAIKTMELVKRWQKMLEEGWTKK